MSDRADVLSVPARLVPPEPWRPKFNPWLIRVGDVVGQTLFIGELFGLAAWPKLRLPTRAGLIVFTPKLRNETPQRCADRDWKWNHAHDGDATLYGRPLPRNQRNSSLLRPNSRRHHVRE
jgi:hypothetical protein